MRISLTLALLLTVAACGGAGSGSVSTAETSLGTVLVNEEGRTLYIFGVDQDGVRACYNDCEANWPVVPAGAGADDVDVDLGSTSRDDGTEQLTINGRPVYLFVGDEAEGDVNGQGLNDVWFVLGVDGEPLTG